MVWPNRCVPVSLTVAALGILSVLLCNGVTKKTLLYHLKSVRPDSKEPPVTTGLRLTPNQGGNKTKRAYGLTPPKHGEGPRKIKYISLIAERHSGSTWMVNFLRKYFRGKDMLVLSGLCTWKHWFQTRMQEGIANGERKCRSTQPCPACYDRNHTLAVVMWRNPYDWTTGMSQRAHHAKFHAGMADDLSTFLTKRWMVPAEKEVSFRVAASKMDPTINFCIDNFLPWEVVPCMPDNRNAIYEVDEHGEAYDNIYELRKAKIEDFNAVRDWVPMYDSIRYEDMLDVDNLKAWLQMLESTYGLVGDKSAVPTEETATAMREKMRDMYYTNSKHCAPTCAMGVQHDAAETMNELFDVDLEGSIGYFKVPAAPQNGSRAF